MELIKRNIHMDRIKADAVTQITLDDDINVSDSKPDVDAVNMEKGEVIIEEVRAATNAVHVRGCLRFAVLYRSAEAGGSLVTLEGQIPFDEKIHLQGAEASDSVTVEGKTEDISVDMINSRKLSVQSVITLYARVEEIYDEMIPVDIRDGECAEMHKVPMEVAEIAICKNDIFRVREEIGLPSQYPNIFRILWNTVSLRDVEFKVLEEKLSVQGDVHLFLLYEGEGEDRPIRSFETTLPFSGTIECHGCREGMVSDVRYRLSQQELTVRPDFDGEERMIGLELTLDITIRVYEEETMEVLTDVYGVTKEVETVLSKTNLRRLLSRVTGKMKVTNHVKIDTGGVPVLQLLHSVGQIAPERQTITEDGILLQGSLVIKTMFITDNDGVPYMSTQIVLPYEYTLDVPGIREEDMGRVHAELEQLQVNMLDGEEVDVKAVLVFNTTVFQNVPMELIGDVIVSELDMHKMSSLPGMVIYKVQPGDNLWNIGKRYYMPVSVLRELNGLENDELTIGQKLLLVKGYV